MKNILLLFVFIASILNAGLTRDNQTGIVTDASREIQWQDNNISAEMGWQDAINGCESSMLGGYNDWRLPNINELRTIIDRSRDEPTVYSSFVYTGHGTLFSSYWSSTTNSNNVNSAWVIGVWRGEVVSFEKSAKLFVRCVRSKR
jgi:hypothetical protein